MKILWLIVVLQTALAQPGFGRSYLRNSRLCHQWSCINTKLNLPDSLPSSAELGNVLRRLLPQGDWQNVVDNVINTCYNDRPRRYANTCPGQAVIHCAVDQLIANCPEASLRKEDACAPVSTLAGVNIMFTQSRYDNLEKNLPFERRPSWFMKHYFNTQCCNLPELFNATTLSECGFTSMIRYHIHTFQPKLENQGVLDTQSVEGNPTTPTNNGDSLQIVSFDDVQAEDTQTITDPLDCCDVADFIQPSWRRECNFELNWDPQSRLVIKHDTPVPTTTPAPVTTSTSSPVVRRDVAMVPHTCEKETCVFNKLNILSSSGVVDIASFTRLLDNFTNYNPTWNSAKARVVTTCLRKPVLDYSAECEINKILTCTFDVLTENCPYAPRSDLCKHTTSQRTCQISSSRYRPKNRRDLCALPELVGQNTLTECGLTSLSKMEAVTTVVKPKTYRLFTSTSKCQDLTPSTSCVMAKMGILNKYKFMDYFKMTERIRNFASRNGVEWSNQEKVYMNGFRNGPLYREHCNSAKKFLNVLDSMLMTCPESKRKNTAQCSAIFNEINNTPANVGNVSQEFTQLVLDHFHHVFFPSALTPKIQPIHTRKVKKMPIYNYGILNDNNAPKVTTIDIKPKTTYSAVNPPLVLLPVYMRIPNSNLAIRRPFNENGVMRSGFSLHNQIAQAHMSTPSSFGTSTPFTTSSSFITSTSSSFSTPHSYSSSMSTSSPHTFVSTSTMSTNYDSKFEMLKPE